MFEIISFLIIKDKIVRIIQFIVEINLYLFLFSFLIIGAFFVSAGAYLNISNIPVIPRIIFNKNGIDIFFDKKGIPINIMDDDKRHIQLLVACNPCAGSLNILKNNSNIISSLNTPNIIDSGIIIINFVIVR